MIRSLPGFNAFPFTGPSLLTDNRNAAVWLIAPSTIAIAVAEFLTAYVNPMYGVMLHLVLLCAFLLLGATVSYHPLRAFFASLSLGPLIRILSLSMPLTHFPQALWYVLTAVPLFSATFLIARDLNLSPSALSLRLPSLRMAPLEVLVAASGFACGAVEFRILHPAPIVPVHAADRILVAVGAAAILLVCTGLLEEVLFRGLLQRVATDLLGSRRGLVVAALIFAILHIGWKSVPDLLFVFGIAIYFGLVVQRTRSLMGVTVAHGAINTMLFVVLPLIASQGR